MKVRSREAATESDCFVVVIGHEVGPLMVSMVPAAVLVPIILYLCFYHGCWECRSLLFLSLGIGDVLVEDDRISKGGLSDIRSLQ